MKSIKLFSTIVSLLITCVYVHSSYGSSSENISRYDFIDQYVNKEVIEGITNYELLPGFCELSSREKIDRANKILDDLLNKTNYKSTDLVYDLLEIAMAAKLFRTGNLLESFHNYGINRIDIVKFILKMEACMLCYSKEFEKNIPNYDFTNWFKEETNLFCKWFAEKNLMTSLRQNDIP